MALDQPMGTLSQPHLLCTSCKSFWQNVSCLKFTTDQLHRGEKGVPSMPQHLLHSQNRTQIKHNASLGCHFCSIMLGSVVGCTGRGCLQPFFEDDSPVYISIDILDQDAGTFLLTLFPCEQVGVNTHDLILNNYALCLYPSTGELDFFLL